MEHYLALFEPDPMVGGYVVTFPDFGYGVTQGETDEEAMEMAQDLLMLTIGDYMREAKPLPAPARRRGAKYRPVPLPEESRVCPLYRNTQDARRGARRGVNRQALSLFNTNAFAQPAVGTRPSSSCSDSGRITFRRARLDQDRPRRRRWNFE